MSAGYVNVTEEAGAAVDAGLLERAVAIELIYAAAAGGLTRLGAETALDEWQTLRARFADIRMDAELVIAACEAEIKRRES